MSFREYMVTSGKIASILTLIALAGCGPSAGTLSGKVTLDGTPLKGGRIDFTNNASGGTSASVEIEENGTYSLPLLFSGDYTVTVTTDYLKPRPTMGTGSGGGPPPGMVVSGKGGPLKGGLPPGMKAGGPPKDFMKEAEKSQKIPEGYKMSSPADAAKRYVSIPQKYSDPATSGLSFKASGSAQTFDIPLVSK